MLLASISLGKLSYSAIQATGVSVPALLNAALKVRAAMSNVSDRRGQDRGSRSMRWPAERKLPVPLNAKVELINQLNRARLHFIEAASCWFPRRTDPWPSVFPSKPDPRTDPNLLPY